MHELVLIVFLVLLALGALPAWAAARSRKWGWLPAGGLGLIVLIMLVTLALASA